MALRSIPTEFDGAVVAEIDGELSRLCVQRDIAIPIAIESGSRAWGFPSPDSDFDCRFIFVRSIERHLSPWAQRDVIELPLEGDLDLNGWDLGKALRLLLKGNAVVIEWLRSPIVYRGEAWFRDGLLDFARRFASREMIGRHYLHLGERQRRVYFGDTSSVPQKKIFYALRPAATLRWLRLHLDAAVAPMHFPTLMAECEPPAEVAAEAESLMARKALTRELGSAELPAVIGEFIDNEFEMARAAFESGRMRLSDDAKDAAEAFYRDAVQRLEGGRRE